MKKKGKISLGIEEGIFDLSHRMNGAPDSRRKMGPGGKKMLFIGVTGGVGAGKSAILKYMEENYNCRVMLADHIAHVLMEPGTDCYGQLQMLFAHDAVFQEDGKIDRTKMAAVLFADDEKREALNDIVHPAVKRYVVQQAGEERKNGQLDFLVIEAALLIEEKYDAICDELWYIYTSEANRRERLKINRGYSDEKIDSIFKSQLTEEIFRAYCAVEIDNNLATDEAFLQVERVLADRGILKIEKEKK